VNRDQLIEDLRATLAKTGFFVSDKQETRGLSFDIAARRDDFLVLIKVLLNVDAYCRESAEELMSIASSLEGAPLLVGLKSGSGELERGVIYSRFGVPIISRDTFTDFLQEGVPPFIFSAPGGLFVRIDNEALRRAREERGISLGTLAETAGVSRRAIQMYLEGMAATVDIALRLEEFLDEPIVLPVDLFSYSEQIERPFPSLEDFEVFERYIFNRLRQLGYSVLPTVRCPFDALTKDKRTLLLTGLGREDRNLEQKAAIVANLSKIVERDSVIFVEKREIRYNLGGAPLVSLQELRKARDRDEVLTLITERKK